MREADPFLVPLHVAAADVAVCAREPDLFGRRKLVVEDLKFRFGPHRSYEFRPWLIDRDGMQADVDARIHIGVVKFVLRAIHLAEQIAWYAKRADGIENTERSYPHLARFMDDGNVSAVMRRSEVEPIRAEPVLRWRTIEIPRALLVFLRA